MLTWETNICVHKQFTTGKILTNQYCNYILILLLKLFQKVAVVNPEENSVHDILIYDGDNLQRVADRVSRAAGILGLQN